MKANAPEKCMIFYHGTSKENWDAIQKEGILYGRRYITDNNGNIIKEIDRCTYLATSKEEAMHYGEVVLQVEYDPLNRNGKTRKDRKGFLNNYSPESWQIRVYEPISIENVKQIKGE